MLSVIKFILNCIVVFVRMLFTINIGNGLNLGLLMCILFIFLPIVHRIVCFIKQDAIEELDDAYDSGESVSILPRYVGRHEYVGHHSKEYHKRQAYNKRRFGA